MERYAKIHIVDIFQLVFRNLPNYCLRFFRQSRVTNWKLIIGIILSDVQKLKRLSIKLLLPQCELEHRIC